MAVKMTNKRFGSHVAHVQESNVAEWEAAGWVKVKEPKAPKQKEIEE